MISFVHTADIHFGVENYGKIDPKTGIHTRLLDFERALNACIDYAIEKKVDFFLFAGDAYKTAHPSPTQQRLLMGCFFRLYAAGIPVVIVVGNHDHPLSFGKAHALDVFKQLPLDGFHVIAKPQTVSLETKHGPVNIVGIPWPTRNTIALKKQHILKSATEISGYLSQAVSSIIAKLADELDPAIPAVLAGHLTVASGIFSGSEKRAIYGNDPIFLPSQLAIKPFDYVALGHLHRYQNLNPKGTCPIVYSGSVERVDFGERKEQKGFCHVTVTTDEKKKKTDLEFIPTPTRPFIQLEIKLNADADQTEQIIAQLSEYAITDAVIKILYHVPEGKKDLVDLPTVQRACAQAMHLVGIIPIRKQEERTRRTTLKVTMDLPTLLDRYFEGKKEHPEKKAELIQMALQLEDQLKEDQTG